MNNTGLLHLYLGEGKGKTTAAVGLVTRAQGAGLRPLLVQFLKGRQSGELASMQKLGVPVCRVAQTEQFLFQMDAEELAACKREYASCFAQAKEALLCGDYDVVVLDEVLDATTAGLVDEQELLETLRQRPPHVEVVLTGRQACGELRDMADYISEICAVKHPYQKGIAARQGIEY